MKHGPLLQPDWLSIPTFTIRRYRKAVRSEDAVVRTQGYRLVEAMRKAGVPEG
jgi:hypothetical protein